MIGWNHVASRDYAELIVNGLVDDDIDRIEETIRTRRDAQVYPACPGCGEPLKERHDHKTTDPKGAIWIEWEPASS